MPTELELVTRSHVPVERLFRESLSIDAHLRSIARSHETAIAGVTRGQIGLGETVTWRARHFGLWFTMTSKITALDAPNSFVDEQIRGPFALFRHEHRFDVERGATVMTDMITVGSPIFGCLIERMALVPYLRRLITARNRHLITRSR